MDLPRAGREFYGVTSIAATDRITGEPIEGLTWEASFDGGVTWVAGTQDAAGWRWLVAGPDFDPADWPGLPVATYTVVPESTQPRIRAVSNPEALVRSGVPQIRVW